MKSLKIIGFRRFILFLMTSVLCMNIALAQKKVISGVVTGTDKEPIPGVTIIEKGTTNGTVSDLDGKYSLSVEPSAILVISFIGMKLRRFRLEIGQFSVHN